MRRIFALLTLLVLFTLSSLSTARAAVYRGAMDNRTGFTPLAGFTAQSNSWYGSGGTAAGKGMRLEWTVDDETNPGYWTYSYTLIRGSAMNKGFALFDIETAPDFTAADINTALSSVVSAADSSGNTTTTDPNNSANSVPIASLVTLSGPHTFNVARDFSNAAVTEADPATRLLSSELSQYSGDPGRVAPGVTTASASATPSVGPVAHPFYGLRWNFPAVAGVYDTCAWQVRLVSTRPPMWGSFFGWGDQTSTSPFWYANIYSNNIDQTERPAAGPLSTIDESGVMLPQFETYRGWILVPGTAFDAIPKVVSTTPFDGTNGVEVGASVTATFNKPIAPASINSATFIVTNSSGSAVSGSINYSTASNTAIFTPNAAFTTSETYRATVTTDVQDLSGMPLAAPNTWTFTITSTPDKTSPTVLSMTPADQTTGIASNIASLSARFSETLRAASVNTSTFTLSACYSNDGCYPTDHSRDVSGTVTYDPVTHTGIFTPTSALNADATYMLYVSTSVRDLAGNFMSIPVSSKFTTNPLPRVVSVNPAGDSSDVPNGTAISATFNIAMNAATFDGTSFSVTDSSGTAFPGSVSYDPTTRTATFVPADLLTYNVTYTATIATSVKDVAGIALTSPVVWSFTTSATDIIPPTVTSVSPAARSIFSEPLSLVSATFSEAMDAETLDGAAFRVTDTTGVAVAGTVSYDAGSHQAIFTPSAPLALDKFYTATITTSARDHAGNALAASNAWSFTLASRIYTGNVSNIHGDQEDGTLIGTTNSWGGEYDPSKPRGIRLSWIIGKAGDLWTYTYNFYGNTKATEKYVTNFDLSTPSGFTSADILPGWTMYRPDAGDITANVSFMTEAATLTEQSIYSQNGVDNVTASESLFGIQWHFNVNYSVKEIPMDMFVLNFTTTRAPTWGDFITYSGATGGGLIPGNPMAWNAQIGIGVSAPPADGNNGGWVLVPGRPASTADATPPIVSAFAMPSTSKTLDTPISAFSATDDTGVTGYLVAENATPPLPGDSGWCQTPPQSFTFSGYGTRTAYAWAKDATGNVSAGVAIQVAITQPKTTPVITWSNPADIGSAAVLSAIQLNATASVPGTFAYSPDSGSMLVPGNQILTLTFTPDDQALYDTATASVGINVIPVGNIVGGTSVSIADALMTLKCVVGLYTPNAAEKARADVAPLVGGKPDPDNKIDITDALVILKRVVGLVNW